MPVIIRVIPKARQVMFVINKHLQSRVRSATTQLFNKVKSNISVPVGISGSEKVRSRPGQYPRKDRGILRNTLILDFKTIGRDVFDGYVGTPMHYGVVLELDSKLNRKWLVRTLMENKSQFVATLIRRII